MSDKSELQTAGKEESESEEMDTEFDDYHLESYDQSEDLDLEEDYLNRLKLQRKRVSLPSRRSRSSHNCISTTRTNYAER
jgi:hypothetical protein